MDVAAVFLFAKCQVDMYNYETETGMFDKYPSDEKYKYKREHPHDESPKFHYRRPEDVGFIKSLSETNVYHYFRYRRPSTTTADGTTTSSTSTTSLYDLEPPQNARFKGITSRPRG